MRQVLHELLNLRRDFNALVHRFEIPEKPDFLPIETEHALRHMEFLSLEQQEKCERYLRHLGGQNLREACHFALRASVSDEVMRSYTFGGLYDEVTGDVLRNAFDGTMLCKTILRNLTGRKDVNVPTENMYGKVMQEVIFLSHQRLRSRRNALIPANERNVRIRRGRPPVNENDPPQDQ